jgi:hypothetical protein
MRDVNKQELLKCVCLGWGVVLIVLIESSFFEKLSRAESFGEVHGACACHLCRGHCPVTRVCHESWVIHHSLLSTSISFHADAHFLLYLILFTLFVKH